MIDLRKLEEKLDLALERETSESLREWLVNNKQKAFLGHGHIENITFKTHRFSFFNTLNETKVDNTDRSSSCLNYSTAA